ncbi:hypothetical protein HMI55_004565, partial [Coelomomyces lativittatus]
MAPEPTSLTSTSTSALISPSLSTTTSNLNKPSASITTTLFETQAVAPAPGQTFYQALIDKDKVILRDWPKLRYSQ